MQQKTTMRKTVRTPPRISPTSYLQADEPSSIGALWWLAIGLAIFWAGVGFGAEALVSWWLAGPGPA